jgi:polyketide cyclase/dehydrase/lipid transport protein
MGMQEIDVRQTSAASPSQLWALLDKSATWPRWTPIETFTLERPAGDDGLGEIRLFKTGRVTVREEIVERRAERRLAYVLLGGLALRDYRAEIDLTPTGEGTAIRWHTTFRAKVPGAGWIYKRALEKVTREFVDGLAEHPGAAASPA